MPSSGTLSTEQHRDRAAHHAYVGDALAATGEPEWAAVCLFYAAYHLMRAALTSDAIFDEPTRLSRISPQLTPADRSTARHKGRKSTSNGREWGINELVFLLYRPLAGDYDRLHQASIDVRYGQGLRGDVADLRGNLTSIEDAYAGGLSA